MGFFSRPEIRQFNYTPRYWDPKKEEMEERRARIREQLQKERERAMNNGDDADDMGFTPRSSADESESNATHRTTLQHGFLREQRGRTGIGGDENKLMKVVVVCGVVLAAYLILKQFGF